MKNGNAQAWSRYAAEQPAASAGSLYRCRWTATEPSATLETAELDLWRERLYRRGLVGMDRSGREFGGISKRCATSTEFIISGADTGGLRRLTAACCSRVLDADVEAFSLSCAGPVEPSGEAMSHAAIYRARADVGGVMHVRDVMLWHSLVQQAPATTVAAQPGSPLMAGQLLELLGGPAQLSFGLICAGACEGMIFSFGCTLADAAAVLFAGMENVL